VLSLPLFTISRWSESVQPYPKTDGAAAFGESSRSVARKIAARDRQATPTGNRYGAIVPALPQGVKGEAAELVGREKAR